MPLDHYIPQVYLKNFCQSGSTQLNAISKRSLKKFPPRTKDVCRIPDGSTNKFIKDPRAVEEFLKSIEPKFNKAVTLIRSESFEVDSIYTVAGLFAFMTSCSPTAMRMYSKPLKAALEVHAELLDRRGKFDDVLSSIGEKSVTELLNNKELEFIVDKKYPQAIGINTITKRLSIAGNSKWEILRIIEADEQFLTSDYPTAIEPFPNGLVHYIFPLAPDLAIRLIPDITLSRSKPDLSFSKFKFRSRIVGRTEINKINRSIVQCAEDVIFYRYEKEWISNFVQKNQGFQIDIVTQKIPTPTGGYLTIATQKIMRSTSN